VDALAQYDYDKARKTAMDKEYMLPKNFKLTLDANGMNVHLENLFNGNKLLGKLV
jgi:xylose isomerase